MDMVKAIEDKIYYQARLTNKKSGSRNRRIYLSECIPFT